MNHEYSEGLVISAEKQFDCCGLGIYDNYTKYDHPTQEEHDWSIEKKVFKEGDKCFDSPDNCKTCFFNISDKVAAGFKAAGGLGLFFSFPEVIIKFNLIIIE